MLKQTVISILCNAEKAVFQVVFADHQLVIIKQPNAFKNFVSNTGWECCPCMESPKRTSLPLIAIHGSTRCLEMVLQWGF